MEGVEATVRFWKPEARHVFLLHWVICGGEWRARKDPESICIMRAHGNRKIGLSTEYLSLSLLNNPAGFSYWPEHISPILELHVSHLFYFPPQIICTALTTLFIWLLTHWLSLYFPSLDPCVIFAFAHDVPSAQIALSPLLATGSVYSPRQRWCLSSPTAIILESKHHTTLQLMLELMSPHEAMNSQSPQTVACFCFHIHHLALYLHSESSLYMHVEG